MPLLAIPAICPIMVGCSNEQIYQIESLNQASDIDWDKTNQANINIYKWSDGPQFEAYAQMVYIKEQEFIVRLVCYETNPTITHSEKFNKNTWDDSCLEVFLNFYPQSDYYLNVEVNAAGCSCQQFGQSWQVAGDRTFIPDSPEYVFNVNATKENDYWQVLIHLPITKICYWYQTVGITIDPSSLISNFSFTGNFFKIQGKPVEKQHYGMWHNMNNELHTFHEPKEFGKLIIK